ncbi:MAG: single-stranded DNA-binding protein [Actinomycetia bacterium]|nr:single-stranded DNA-binding protein [Actinomycetes bacterium]
MNDTYLTIVGNLVEDPRLRETTAGVPVASFRVASTSRRLDRDTGQWIDNEKLYATVTCWRGMARNVATSLRKGHPVIVTGRFYSRNYVAKDETSRASYELDAIAVGHDLSRGSAQFTKVTRPAVVTTVEVDETGVPADLTDLRIETAPATVDELCEREELLERELATVS